MADAGGRSGRGGRGREGGRDGGRGRGGRGRGRGRGEPAKAEEWIPVTKLGRLVKDGKIKSLEEIFLFSIPIKEAEIVDKLAVGLKDEVMKVFPIQYQTAAGQRTRFKAYVAVGDSDGHIGLGSKVASEVAKAIKSAIAQAKMNIVPIRRGYWGNNVGMPHTVPAKTTGKCGSVTVRLIPAPRGTGLVASPSVKRLLTMAGIGDCYTCSRGHTKTSGNFLKAVYGALEKTYTFLSPDLWMDTALTMHPFHQHTDYLEKTGSGAAAGVTTQASSL